MSKPTLIIMAAGMGSRYGGLKQIDKITKEGEILLDFSLYDAMMAGFEKVVFIIREEHETAFRDLLDSRAGRFLDIKYAFQDLKNVPAGCEIPEGREKPWGTCHAVMSAKDLVDGSFAVINADDYYGPGAFQKIYEFLDKSEGNQRDDGAKYKFAMVGYKLANTLSESGHVARGVCSISEKGFLTEVVERTKIMRRDGDIEFAQERVAGPSQGDSQGVGSLQEVWEKLPEETIVSMNFWGFTKDMMEEMEKGFPRFFEEKVSGNPLKAEYFLPSVVEDLIKSNKAEVKVLTSMDKWYGMTYKEDKTQVEAALQSMKDKGIYPEKLWK